MAKPPLDILNTIMLGREHHHAGRLDEAAQAYLSVLEANPRDAVANHLLGVLAYQTGNHDKAAQLIARAVVQEAENPEYLNDLGLALQAQLRLDQALLVYQQAITAKPDHADAHNNRGLVLLTQGKLSEAAAAFRRATSIDPDFAEAHNNLGNALEAQGNITEALAAYEKALASKPDFAGAHSNLLLCLHYDSDTNAREILAAHREWNARHAATIPPDATHSRSSKDPDKRLRIGYVSADFCRHPVASFIEPLLEAHDREAFEVFCYSNVSVPDEVTERLSQLDLSWRSIRGTSDEDVAELIRRDGIDILIDLSGHTGGHRLLALAQKPAPILVTYLGYPGTSGLGVMDYRLTDAWLDPADTTDTLYTEELVRLPEGSLCFLPSSTGPEVTPLADLTPGEVTFVSFNNAAKVSPATVALWSKVLLAVPEAKMLLKSKSFGDVEAVERVRKLFEDQGIPADRLEFVSWLPASEDHLALYGRVHIGLDTLPYSGCTTSCEALWMGIPVITLQSDEPRSRMSLAVLNQAGLEELVAESEDAFVSIAERLATDIGRLREVRSGLRDRLRQSSLLDSARFARDVESAYRQMWQRYLA